MAIKFVKFPSIEKFSDVNVMVRRAFEVEQRPTVTYRGKIKLHGTNSLVIVSPDGDVQAGKRTGIINVQNDNAGFANWLETVKQYFKPIEGATFIIYGEWAGPGVQRGVAVSQIEKKTFFPFSVYFPETDVWGYEPETIKLYVAGVPDIQVLPWGTPELTVDFRLTSSMERFTAEIAEMVESCDKSDPFIKEQFGIDGVGEGYVMYPTDVWLTRGEHKKYRSQYLFKARGESHSNSKVSTFKAIVPVDPVIAESTSAFVRQFVTEARLRQGLIEACEGLALTKNIGPFMAWLGNDVKKESANELEASGLTWKDVGKSVNQYARDWFILEIEKTQV